MPQQILASLVATWRSRFSQLPDKPNETVEATVRALWLSAAGILVSADRALTMTLPDLTAQQEQRLDQLLALREQGTPLAYLTGRQQFMGLEFICSPQALIPRKETEILGAAVRDLLRQDMPGTGAYLKVLDLCTGAGNLALTVARNAPSCVVFGVDLSPAALELARSNALHLGCGDRVKLFCGDLFGPLESEEFYHSFDLIVCNPPYISTARLASMNAEIAEHEPRMAFDGGPLGVGVLWRLLHDAPRFLKAGAWLGFEVGAGQGEAMVRRLSRNPGFSRVTGLKDSGATIRAILGKLSNPNPGHDAETFCDTLESSHKRL